MLPNCQSSLIPYSIPERNQHQQHGEKHGQVDDGVVGALEQFVGQTGPLFQELQALVDCRNLVIFNPRFQLVNFGGDSGCQTCQLSDFISLGLKQLPGIRN